MKCRKGNRVSGEEQILVLNSYSDGNKLTGCWKNWDLINSERCNSLEWGHSKQIEHMKGGGRF